MIRLLFILLHGYISLPLHIVFQVLLIIFSIVLVVMRGIFCYISVSLRLFSAASLYESMLITQNSIPLSPHRYTSGFAQRVLMACFSHHVKFDHFSLA